MEMYAAYEDLTGKGLDELDKIGALDREDIMNEKRHWVRISRTCNSKCVFCLDADAQNGTFIDFDECVEEFKRGKERGATRLIISGGEASIHPRFIDLIRVGKQELGFKKVQTITNGAMFANKSFAFAALDAGLDESTFSIHAHQPSLSDHLNGMKGYHIRAVRGLLNMLHSRRIIVNMDIVINRLNFKHLPDILTYFYKLGVREFDLMYLVPFGRVMHEETENLFFDPQELAPYLHKTLTLAAKWGCVVWTNRLPPPVLEDFEHYIQDPHKIEVEMYGRRKEFRKGLDKLEPPSCYGDSCPECFVRDMCGLIQVDNKKLMVDKFDYLEAEADGKNFTEDVVKPRQEVVAKAKQLHIDAKTVREANRFADWELPERITMKLGSMEAFDELDSDLRSRLVRLDVDTAMSLTHLVTADVDCDLQIELTKTTVPWLKSHVGLLEKTGRSISLKWSNTLMLQDSVETHAELEDMKAVIEETGFPVINVAPCLSGGQEFVYPEDTFNIDLVQNDGKIDIVHYANHYVTHDYYSKSLRCRECIHDAECPGIHINIVRHFGYKKATNPITETAYAESA